MQTSRNEQLVCIATFLPVRRWRYVIPFLWMTFRVANQVKKMQGLVRYALKPYLPRRHFWTLTVWKDRGSVNAFVTSEPHHTAVRKFDEWAAEGAAFAEWNSSTSSIDWEQALERLKTPTFYHTPPARQI